MYSNQIGRWNFIADIGFDPELKYPAQASNSQTLDMTTTIGIKKKEDVVNKEDGIENWYSSCSLSRPA